MDNLSVSLISHPNHKIIGILGPISWQAGAMCLNFEDQLSQSRWIITHQPLKQRIEWELIKCRNQLQLYKQFNKRTFFAVFFLALIIIQIIIFPTAIGIFKLRIILSIWLVTFFLTLFLFIFIICKFQHRLFMKINSAIDNLNKFVQEQKLGIKIVAKKHSNQKSFLNLRFFQVYQIIET